MNTAQRRQVLLDAFDLHEEMVTLLNCLTRSPTIYDDPDDDDFEQGKVQERLIDDGFLSMDAGFCQTTSAGREALVAYILGTDSKNNERGY